MKSFKNSGIEWIGDIPNDWDVKAAFQIFSQVKNKNEGLTETNLLSLSYGKIKRKNIDTVGGLLPESFDGYNIIESGDIVLRLTDLQNDQTSLRVGLSEERGIVTSAYLTLRNQSGNFTKYLYYYLHTFDICKGFYGMGAGVRQGLNWEGLKLLKITLPPMCEQHRIVDFLDSECARIDAVIEQTRASIEEYKKLKQSVITEAVTKGIRGDRPMKDSGIEWIGEIPDDWEPIKFKHMASVKSNLVDPAEYGDYIQVSPENIEKGSGRLLPCKTVSEVGVISGNHLFFKDQILYSKIRPKLNKVTIAPFVGLCSADMYPIETSQNVKFVLYAMLSDVLLAQVSMITEDRVKMPKINQDELGNTWFAKPLINEQAEIVAFLDQRCKELDELIDAKIQLLSELEAYKKSVIYEYVTGKKEV